MRCFCQNLTFHETNTLRGDHLPNFCENIKVTRINFKTGSPAPAYTGLRNFSSCIFNIRFTGEVLFPTWLQTKGSQQGGCLLGSCFICDSSRYLESKLVYHLFTSEFQIDSLKTLGTITKKYDF